MKILQKQLVKCSWNLSVKRDILTGTKLWEKYIKLS